MIEARVQAVSSDRGEDSPSVELSCGSAERGTSVSESVPFSFWADRGSFPSSLIREASPDESTGELIASMVSQLPKEDGVKRPLLYNLS